VFARATGADLDEAELELAAYPSLGDLFARRLRPGVRPIDPDPLAIIAPCDGAVAAAGVVDDGYLIQAKGIRYKLADLVVDSRLADRLTGGAYATIYLSPRDYHRVHAPVGARIVAYDYVPGALWPVNPMVATRRPGLFVRNERVVISLDAGRLGPVAIVMVGAAGVGNIALAHAEESVAWRAAGERRRIELGERAVARGDELGAFRLGSTVVMIFAPGVAELAGEGSVRFGQRLGRVLA
jgi:phosphatidylserine decarboxylase